MIKSILKPIKNLLISKFLVKHVVDGSWQPNDEEKAAGRIPGFGATIMVINGGLECGSPNDARSLNRQKHYKQYCEMFGLQIKPEERLDCAGMGQFSASGKNSYLSVESPLIGLISSFL